MPPFGGNPNRSLDNPFKPGQPGVGMQPHNRINAMTGRMQPQMTRPGVRSWGPNANRTPGGGLFGPPRPSQQEPRSFVSEMFGPYMPTIYELLGGMVPPVMPYVRPPNIDLYGALFGEYRDLTDTSLPLLDQLLGQEIAMEKLIESQSNDLLRQLLGTTSAVPNPRPRSGTSYFRGFNG